MNYDLLTDLIDCIKESEEYQDFIFQSSRLKEPEVQDLLIELHTVQQEYMYLKQFESYIDLDKQKEELKRLRIELNSLNAIEDYYSSYYKLNECLNAVTEIIFKDIDESLLM